MSNRLFTTSDSDVEDQSKNVTEDQEIPSLNRVHISPTASSPRNLIDRSEPYASEDSTYSPDAEVLLVVNSSSMSVEVQSWIDLIENQLGLKTCIWSISLQNGFDLHHIMLDGTSLGDKFSGKTILLLNNTFHFGSHQDVCALNFITPREIYESSMKLQIQFLIYGGASIDLSKDVLPNSKGQRSRFMYSEEGHLLFHLQAEHSLGQSITQVFHPDDQADVCGSLIIFGRLSWYSLHLSARVLCIYGSGNQPYPSRIFKLGRHIIIDVQGESHVGGFEENEAGYSFHLVNEETSLTIQVPPDAQVQRKRSRYSHRHNYTEGAAALIGLLLPSALERIVSAGDLDPQHMTSCGSLRYKIEEQGKRETQEVQAWFVLNMEKGILFCSRDLNSTLHPTFALVVTQYEISTSVNRNHNGSQLFGWMTWGNNEFTMMGKERKLTFYAKGEEDRNGWLTVLNHVTQRGKRRVNTWALPETKRVGDVVGIIPLENQFYLRSSMPTYQVNKDSVIKRHQELMDRIRSHFPNSGLITFHRVTDDKVNNKRGLATYHIGDIMIYQGLPADSTHIAQQLIPDEEMHVEKRHPPDVFALLKILPFHLKMNTLCRLLEIEKVKRQERDTCVASEASLLGLCVASILSDVAEDFIQWRPHIVYNHDKRSSICPLSKVTRLCEQLRGMLDPRMRSAPEASTSIVGDLTLELWMHVQVMGCEGQGANQNQLSEFLQPWKTLFPAAGADPLLKRKRRLWGAAFCAGRTNAQILEQYTRPFPQITTDSAAARSRTVAQAEPEEESEYRKIRGEGDDGKTVRGERVNVNVSY